MNPGQQLHRSLTFWAGLLLIIFTCWVWRDSYPHSVVFRWKQIYAISDIGSITIYRWPDESEPLHLFITAWKPSPGETPASAFEAPYLVRWDSEMNSDDSPAKQSLRLAVNRSDKGAWATRLPYSYIILIPLLTWTALLFHRARRRRRALIAPPLDPISS